MKNRCNFIVAALLVLSILVVVAPSPVVAASSFSGHVPTANIGYTDGIHLTVYTIAPNMRQGNSSTAAAKSTIAACDTTDLYVNFNFDTNNCPFAENLR